ncbi:alpha/beta fold hydrolase [Nonomuraea sp. NPDC050556]|uniref:alpha/beta fold hydrolase n=1 Tax=Nonomuraea sp. NPDC050556 TaxID=3364369 RepID=UPI00379860C6
MFEGFATESVPTEEVRHGGSGPPVLLLHGHPRTHATWHRLAPLLAQDFTIVCPDLRGYGRSAKPPTTDDHEPYSKRAMARDALAVMRAPQAHDRGCYVAQRLALDNPAAITRLAVLDGVPIGEALARADARFAARWWHWFFLGQTAKPAEPLINADPDAWYRGTPEEMGAEAYEDYRNAIHDPATVHAMCEDYRAGLGVDRAADDADREEGRRITCPVLFLWAGRDDMEELYGDPLAIWRSWADDVRGERIDSGHHMAEEAPEDLAEHLRRFFKAG